MNGVKIVIAIRRDLLDRVIQETRDAGFQEEKYEPLYLNLKWSKGQLFEMLDKRINKLIRRRYTGALVSLKDLVPNTVNRKPTDEYMIDRTMYRPRDLIVFFNMCIQQAHGRPEITAQMILHAESEYSRRRLRSLFDEWHVEFPELPDCTNVLKRSPSRFHKGDIADQDIQELCISLSSEESGHSGKLLEWASRVLEGRMPLNELRARLLSVFYQVGLVGLRVEKCTAPIWSFRHDPSVPWSSIKEETSVLVCPIFWRVLGTRPIGDER